jgi:transposase
MTTTNGGIREVMRYSETFKLSVVHELEAGGLTFEALRIKYGVKGRYTIQRWVGKYGNGTRGKVTRVAKPEEINQLAELKMRVRRLESALADANVDLALERAYMRLACQRAGIQDVAEFKKKVGGTPDIKP